MKTLSDGKEVSARTYYYLLDYMDRHWDDQPLKKLCGKSRLMDTTIQEYINFFEKATADDLQELKK